MSLSPDGILTKDTLVTDLILAAQEVRNVMPQAMERKGVGITEQNVERLSALMDPRRKLFDDGNSKTVFPLSRKRPKRA